MARAKQHGGSSASEPANELATRLGPFWSIDKAAAELQLEHADLRDLVDAGDVLAMGTDDREPALLFPLGQFERTNIGVRVRPAVSAMLKQLRDQDRWSVALLLTIPAPELDGRTPYEAVTDGADPDQLADFARLVRREWR